MSCLANLVLFSGVFLTTHPRFKPPSLEFVFILTKQPKPVRKRRDGTCGSSAADGRTMHFSPVHFESCHGFQLCDALIRMQFTRCHLSLFAFWFMCISLTVLLSLSCCLHMWRVKDNANTNTSIVSAEAPTVHCSALTDIFPLSNVTDQLCKTAAWLTLMFGTCGRYPWRCSFFPNCVKIGAK